MTSYEVLIPELVARAHELAESIGFPLMPEGRGASSDAAATATAPSDGALLRSLAAGYPRGLLGEIGTGPGVSAAWLLSGMSDNVRLITCDIDAELTRSVAAFFADDRRVTVRTGDWQDVLVPSAPFDLLFLDGGAESLMMDRSNWARLVELVKVGGKLVMDDLTPVEMWPPEWHGMTDFKREFCLRNPRFAGVEVRTSQRTVCVIGTRLS